MTIDLDTFLTSAYCITADLYQAYCARDKPVRRGPRPRVSDEEVLTLMLLAQWEPKRSLRAIERYAARHWRGYFPQQLSQSQLVRRSQDLMGVMAVIGVAIAATLSAVLGGATYEVLDTRPGPLMRRCRGNRHRCFANEAAIGCGGSDRDWYYGVKALLAVNDHALITGYMIAPANTDDRWVAEALLRWRRFPYAPMPQLADLDAHLSKRMPGRGPRQGPTGPLAPSLAAGHATADFYLADLGFAGQAWQRHWQLDYQATVITQANFDGLPQEQCLDRQLHQRRQVIEQVNHVLDECLGFTFPKARTYWGLLTRYVAKIAAYNLMRYLNFLGGLPPLAQSSPFD